VRRTWLYRFRRWWTIHVSWLGINDPDDVPRYFAAQKYLIAEREHDATDRRPQ
jgi:hypothetical protein